ncbi:hypothetical protein [Clostridium sp. LP20]|uniref:hypothetical protein n=1 Tax=Clostridium sp. LP20 TaxID=3418665 RepID=UPI003EE543A3
MGIYKFAKKMFKSDFKKSIFYVLAIAIMTVFMFNAINISYNEVIYSDKNEFIDVADGPDLGSNVSKPVRLIRTPIRVVQKGNLCILLIITAFFGVFCNINHIKRKSKEIAFIISNGSSLVDVSRYLVYVNGMNYIIGATAGIIIGIATIPIFNKIMYLALGISGNIFILNSSAILMALTYVGLQFFTVVVLNFGYVYRKEVTELMKMESVISFKDNRNIKTPGFVFFIIYIWSIGMNFFAANTYQGENLAFVLAYTGMIGLYGLIKYYIPKVLGVIKKKEFMYKNHRRVCWSNFLYSLKNSIIYLLGMVFIMGYFIKSIVNYWSFEGLRGNTLFDMICSSIVIGLCLVYSLLVDTGDKMNIYNQLRILGYRKKEIETVINKESVLFFLFGLFLSVSVTLSTIFVLLSRGIFSLSYGINILIVQVAPLIIAGIISNTINRKKVITTIYNEKNIVALVEM